MGSLLFKSLKYEQAAKPEQIRLRKKESHGLLCLWLARARCLRWSDGLGLGERSETDKD